MKQEIIKSELEVNNNKIKVVTIDNKEFISLTNLARYVILKSQKSQYKLGWEIKMLLLI